MEKPNYTKIYNEEAVITARELLEDVVAVKDHFIPDYLEEGSKGYNEKKKEFEEKNTDFSLGIIAKLAEKKIPAHYATLPIDKIIAQLEELKNFIEGTVRSHEDEYLARSFGKKSYDGKYRYDEVTLGDLLLKLNEAREATGNDNKDYFNI